jgi:GDP-L-fucose synthase
VRNKKVAVTGATGMIGRQLTELLVKNNCEVRAISLDLIDKDPIFEQVNLIRADLRDFSACMEVTKDVDAVFHLAGVKGSPMMTKNQPASFFTNTLMFNTNIMEAARRNGIPKFLYTSSIGVYEPKELLIEDDVWKTFPSENDKFAGYAKRMGELQAQAMEIEFGWTGIRIVRPANVFGPWDNFDPDNAMVIPSLISRISRGENPLSIWGDGSAVRDFIHAKEVASAMIQVMDSNERRPVNIGSGIGVSISQIADIFKSFLPELEVKWDTSKPTGDAIRLMDISRLQSLGYSPQMNLSDSIQETYEWYQRNSSKLSGRYNAFRENRS